MLVPVALVDQIVKANGVHFEGDIGVYPYPQAVAQEKRRFLVAIGRRQFRDHLAQAEKRLAEVYLG